MSLIRRMVIPVGILAAGILIGSLLPADATPRYTALAVDFVAPSSAGALLPVLSSRSAATAPADSAPDTASDSAPAAASGSGNAADSGTAAGSEPGKPDPGTPAGGVLRNEGSLAPRIQPGRIGVATGPITIRYTFDGGIKQPIVDQNGGHLLRPLGQNGGALRLVPANSGFAVEYPNRCTLARQNNCARAILEGTRDDSLNPGTRPIQFGASIMMTHADLSDGANVVQKGYSVGSGSEYKLQVDHLQGQPSCVVVGRNREIYRAQPRIDVADGHWHNLSCVRTKSALTLDIDGTPRATVGIPSTLSIANPEPLRVGGKGPAKGNDQYAGQIDNVFVSIS